MAMIRPIPDSDDSGVAESNPCHVPAGRPDGGQFCSTSGSPSRQPIRVGITAARPPGDAAYKTNRQIAEQMRVLEANLRRLPGVRSVSVKPAIGQWAGGSEFSFAVSYIGNGEAIRLLARAGKAWNQDAVLVLRRPKAGETPDAAVELFFDKAGSEIRKQVSQQLGDLGFAGWTWFKHRGKTVLRLVSVPQWGGDNALHRKRVVRLGNWLAQARIGYRLRELRVKADVMEREGLYAYDTVLGGSR